MTKVVSFELDHRAIELFYDLADGWLIHDGEAMQYHTTFSQASEAMDDLISAMKEGRDER